VSVWLYEAGIGETRAALVAAGRIVRARIEPVDAALRVGAVVEAVLVEAGRQPRVRLPDGGEAMLSRVPPALSIGRPLLVEITRQSLAEGRRVKLPRATPADTDATPGPGRSLLDRITASGVPVRRLHAHDADALEEAGWSEVLDEAMTGDIAFPGGVLRMALTPAMTLFDVDGDGPGDALACAAAIAVGEAVVRHGIGGSIGIDFPTLGGKAARQAVAEALDAVLPLPFERTAVNGFGFLQIIRPRRYASLPEQMAATPEDAAARAALRRLEREPPPGPATRPLPADIAHWLNERRPQWVEELHRRTGNAAPITDIGG
jgi:hypothetical protein